MSEPETTVHSSSLPKGRSLWADAIISLPLIVAGRGLRGRKLATISFIIIILYFLLAAFIYLAEIFDWRVPPTQWAQQVGDS